MEKKRKMNEKNEQIVDPSSPVAQVNSDHLEEHSIEDVKKILLGLSSSVEEEKVRFLSIAFGYVTIVKKGTVQLRLSYHYHYYILL